MLDTKANRELMEKAVYLYKIALANAAQSCGAEVRYMSQHSIIWGAMGKGEFDPDFWLGLCAGLSIEWIKRRCEGKDLIQELSTARNDVFQKANGDRPNLEALVGGIQGSHYKQNKLAQALSGVCNKSGRPGESLYPFVNLGSSLTVAGAYYSISSGSHAMAACYRSPKDLDFYDPNVGEACKLTVRALQNYLKNAFEGSMTAQGKPFSDLKVKKVDLTGFTPV